MRIAVVINPKAGSSAQSAPLCERLANRPDVTLLTPDGGDDLGRLAADAARSGRFDVVAVAGGDGTVHAAVNALGPDFPRTPLAVIPLGTGNDLCRTLGVPLEPEKAAGLLTRPRLRRIDVVRVEGGERPFLVNAASGGFSGKVTSELTSDVKEAWGPLAYLRGAAGTIADPPTYRVTFRYDGGPPVTQDVLNVVVANARTVGGGVVVAPGADPEDGFLDVVVVRPGDFVDRTVITARLLAGEYLKDELVTHRRARRVEIESEPPIPFSLDGEVTEGRRFAFAAVRRALPVVVGPDYRRRPHRRWKGVRQRVLTGAAELLDAGKRMFRGDRAGAGVVALVVILFALLAHGVLRGAWAAENEAAMAAARRHATPALDDFAAALTRLGSLPEMAVVTVAALALLAWRRRFADAATVVAVVLGCGLMEVVMKAAFGVDRPGLAGRVVPASWYSFPSGHALRAVGLFGCLAVLLLRVDPRAWWRWVVAAALLAVAAGVCWTRVYLGVHWPTDVVAGALAAAAWVGCCLIARHHIRRRRAAPPSLPSPSPPDVISSRENSP